MPPPNIIQQQPPPQQNIIFQTNANPSNQIPLQQLQLHAPPQIVESTIQNGNELENGATIKDEKSTPEPNGGSPGKPDDKSDIDNHENHENNQQLNQPVMQPQIPMNVPPPIQFAQAPIMAVPPPITCVQHIVGNTLITSSQPSGTQTHQIYNQIPVSIQQIQQPTQQIHVSSGQHILLNAQPYQTQQTFQQMPPNVQSFHITTAPQQR